MRARRLAIILCVLLSLLALAAGGLLRAVSLRPAYLRVVEGQEFDLNPGFNLSGAFVADPPDSLLIDRATGGSISVTPTKSGRARVEFRLFNAIAVRRFVVDVVPESRVALGGHSIGILLASHGVRVIGLYPVIGIDGGRYMPARDAGLAVGDTILAVGGREVSDPVELETAVNQVASARGAVPLGVLREGEEREVVVEAVLTDSGFRIGVYVRDNAAGVGTLTFWHPASLRFGALGHLVTDSQTGKEIPISDGRIVAARVAGVDAGAAGRPGEKIGTFAGVRDNVGVIEVNSSIGIYGRLTAPLANPVFPEPIPVALASSVHEGPAEILTVISGSTIERFRVEISKVTRQTRPSGKGMVIRVVDPRLIERTGGIVQGMSGSPIVQDGKLVGAVTHVFVSDPTRGYAVFAEYMLDAAGIPAEQQQLLP
jgi:stage IV sporulation protein B